MKLSFLGAARQVTGSCYLLEGLGLKILIDCGMSQGPDLFETQTLLVYPPDIDCVLLTHAHIDHSGLLPLLGANGFKGSLRSKDEVNVSDVCLLLGGGGHPKAAGCFVSGTLEQAKSKVLNAIKQEMK